jgi:hypothetical protein
MSSRPMSRPNMSMRYSYSTATGIFCASNRPDRYRLSMSADPRAALNQLVTAFERHLEASSMRRGEEDPGVVAAYEDLADAFESYDAALYDAYGEMTPMDIYSDDDGADDDGADDDGAGGGDPDDDDPDDELDDLGGDDDRLYTGLDDDLDYDDDDEDEQDGEDAREDPTGDGEPWGDESPHERADDAPDPAAGERVRTVAHPDT